MVSICPAVLMNGLHGCGTESVRKVHYTGNSKKGQMGVAPPPKTDNRSINALSDWRLGHEMTRSKCCALVVACAFHHVLLNVSVNYRSQILSSMTLMLNQRQSRTMTRTLDRRGKRRMHLMTASPVSWLDSSPSPPLFVFPSLPRSDPQFRSCS